MRPESSDLAFTCRNFCTAEDARRSQYLTSSIERRLSHLVRRNPGPENRYASAATAGSATSAIALLLTPAGD
jgi:hypothetical protein